VKLILSTLSAAGSVGFGSDFKVFLAIGQVFNVNKSNLKSFFFVIASFLSSGCFFR
jgi:hypothetical protein